MNTQVNTQVNKCYLYMYMKPFVGTNQAKIIEFLRSLVSAIRCEANKINQRRKERPIGLRTVKMLRDLRRRARVRRCDMLQRRTSAPK